MVEDLDGQLASVGLLAEPARRALYEHVLSSTDAVSREQAAEALSMPPHSVKFHLDKLVAAGLLEVEYRRLTGRSGPGAGRPAKLYRRSDREVALSVPPRRYDLAGQVLAEAVDRAAREDVPVATLVQRVARDVGRELGTASVPSLEDVGDDLARTAEVLEQHGYQPRTVEREMCLTNCPFDRLVADHTELVCGLNLALVEGVLDGLEATALEARLEPATGLCCVRVAG